MNKKDFANILISEIQEDFPGCKMMIREIPKANKGVLTGVEVKPSGASVVPMFYVDEPYRDYIRGDVSIGTQIESLKRAIREALEKSMMFCSELPFEAAKGRISLLEAAKDRISLRVLNTERNQDYLERVQHVSLGCNLTAVLVVDFGDTDMGRPFVAVTNEMAEEHKKSTEELFSLALDNSPVIDEPVLMVLEEALTPRAKNILDNEDTPVRDVLCLTTKSRVNGAKAFFYRGIQEKISKIVGGSYLVIPTSIEEVLIVPESLGADPKDVCESLAVGNSTVVRPDQILSDVPFFYDSNLTTLEPVVGMVEGGVS